MRGASIGAVVAGVLALGCCSAADAAPTVTLKAQPVPVAGFAHTGNIYGAGAALALEYQIAGSEYRGFPPPLVGLTVTLPQGAKIHSTGFPTCAQATLEQGGPPACTRGMHAGPPGAALVDVPAVASQPASRPVLERLLTVEPFYSPGGGLLIAFVNPAGRATLGLAPAAWTSLAGAAGAGPELSIEVPLLEPAGAAADPSLQKLSFRIGTAIKRSREAGAASTIVSYLSVPRMGKCPRGGFQFSSTLSFAGLADIGAGPFVSSTSASGLWPERQLVTVSYRGPCPRRGAGGSVPPPPPAPTTLHGSHDLITALANTECVGEEGLVLHVLARRRLVWRRITLLLDGQVVQVLRGRRHSAALTLDPPPGGRFRVKVVATTVGGRRVAGSRSYSVCPSQPG